MSLTNKGDIDVDCNIFRVNAKEKIELVSPMISENGV